jgi:hypothetical protein
MSINGSFRCPVCRAGFRGTRKCSRCGADLTILMTLSVSTYLCRANTRKAICSGDIKKAHDLATEAQRLHATETGRRLLLLTSWLNAEIFRKSPRV